MFMEYVVCNRKTSILKDGKSKLTYFDILSNVLEKVPANGLILAEMKKDFELLDKLNNKEENCLPFLECKNSRKNFKKVRKKC